MIGSNVATTVYWTCVEDDSDQDPTPVSIQKRYYDKYSYGVSGLNNQNRCPAFNSFLKNTYGLVSIYNFGFTLGNDGIEVPEYFFSKENIDRLMIREINEKFFSWKQRYLFFSDADILKTTFYIPPFFENNFIYNNTIPLPGEYDISKWFRNSEFPFYLKGDSFNINVGDIYAYIRFNTDDRVKMKRFNKTDKITDIWQSSVMSSSYKEKSSPLSYFYDSFNKNKIKKELIKEIKQNLYS